jgi:class 3 adenylate cyclase
MVQEQIRIGRRLSAILAADVAGYSRLMGLDEAGTARTLREHRVVSDALVATHGGRIVKTTGDGLLLEFPSVVDAVECAVVVQVLLAERNDDVPRDRRMLYRIGINLCEILIEGYRTPQDWRSAFSLARMLPKMPLGRKMMKTTSSTP